jgi:hypothetical protein
MHQVNETVGTDKANVGPVVVVSEGVMDVSKGTRFTDNTRLAIGTGPGTRVRIHDHSIFQKWRDDFGGTAPQGCDVVIANSWFADNVVAEDGGAPSSMQFEH